MRQQTLVASFLLSLTACGGSTVDIGAFDAAPLPDSAVPSADSGVPAANDASIDAAVATQDGGVATGASYEIHVRATQTPVTFMDGYAGETPVDQRMGVRKLTLLRNASDPSPVVVFDNGTNPVEAGLNNGNDTICGSALATSLPAGTFTIAHVTIGYYKFTVAATLHDDGLSVAGDYSDLEVLTNATLVDGQTFNQGHYSYTFEVGSTQYATLSGEDLVTPWDNTGGGLSLVTMGGEVDYVFAVNLQLNPALTSTVKVVLTTNTYENFRWQDEADPGYEPGVFDTTTTTYEPVMSFGANWFTVGFE